MDTYLGKLCMLGHDHNGSGKSLCYVHAGRDCCVVCREMRRTNPKGYEVGYKRAHQLKNKEKIRARMKEYRLKNKEKIREHYKGYWLKNKEKMNEKNRKYRLKNKGKIRAYRLKNKERTRAYYLKNKERARERTADGIAELSDNYIKSLARQQFKIKAADVTPEMIELKREQLTMYRLMKEVKHG